MKDPEATILLVLPTLVLHAESEYVDRKHLRNRRWKVRRVSVSGVQ